MISSPESFYNDQLLAYQKRLSKILSHLKISSGLRLTWFIGVLGIGYFIYPSVQGIIILLLIGLIGFLYLVTRHNSLNYKKRKCQKILQINKAELSIGKGEFDQMDAGTEFIDPKHEFSNDVDIFGKHSFFQYINRTQLLESKQYLATLLTENTIDQIDKKQQAIKELAGRPDWRQNYSAIAALLRTEIKVDTVINWIKTHRSFLPKQMLYYGQLFTVLSLIILVLYFFEIINSTLLITWFFVGLGITGLFLKKINNLYNQAGTSKDVFKQYYQLVEFIEKAEFKSSLLKDQQDLLLQKKQKASQILKRFFNILDAFDQRNNMIYGVFGNAFLLWDLMQVARIDNWMYTYKEEVKQWFEVVTFFDAYNSLGNFTFNHPKFVFPTITQQKCISKTKNLGHPMLFSKKRVDNDFCINREEFFIITGANMAGKSTFLRTVALQIIMSNVGLPICASSCSYHPVKLITSMRTSDSLSEESSYFFSELTQLKRIVDALETENYFIILDEILKGTNSKDKAEGSKKFVEKLVQLRATGIIATHDLSLCEIANDIDVVKNKYFDAQIKDGELYFDYRFKEGICKNMNASFLLHKMGIV